jgi:hypothetical protein
MTQAQKRIREYLAEIGKRGGLASRRELTKSHARQRVAIREAKRAALKGGVGRAANITAGRGTCLGGRPGTEIGYLGKPWPPTNPRDRRQLKLG